jgi:hypothetical protein
VATHDYVIANGTGAAVRSDLNGALAAIVSNNSNATAPATTYAYQWWADTTTGLLKIRNSANSAWISLRELDGTLTIEDGTAAAPGLAFTSDLNTGLLRVGADQLAISTGGTSRLAVSTTAVSSTLAVDVPLGAVGTPSITFTGDLNTGIWSPAADTIAFSEGGAEAMRIDSSSRLLVGTSSAFDTTGDALIQAATSNGAFACLGNSDTSVVANENLGLLRFFSRGGSVWEEGARIEAEADLDHASGDKPTRLVFSTTADGAASPNPQVTITNGGLLLVGTTDGANPSVADKGYFKAYGRSDRSSFFALGYSQTVGYFNRTFNDGTLVEFLQADTTEGTISVSGTTVSYNGAHLSRWSQLPGGATREEILRGTLLSNLDEMCGWGEEDNEQLNRMKVSDVEGDKNVSGVFQCWDDDDDTYTDDFYCAMTGDFIIRIAEGVVIERGDLLMSAGDGTAKPQADDIIRSKTIAKVTSTHVTCIYEDGSYCVPCVLMAC